MISECKVSLGKRSCQDYLTLPEIFRLFMLKSDIREKKRIYHHIFSASWPTNIIHVRVV